MNTNRRYWIIDAPGIAGSGPISQQRLTEHLAAGGDLIHEVGPDGFLANPEAMWPGRRLEGKRVRPDGTTVE